LLLGLDGVILLAYIIAIPANEIVVPTMMMVYMGAGMMVNGPIQQFRDLRPTGQRQWLDNAHSGQLDVVRAAAQSMRHDDHDHLQGNQIIEVGNPERCDDFGNRIFSDLLNRKHRKIVRLGLTPSSKKV
jgi:hypothetical protein